MKAANWRRPTPHYCTSAIWLSIAVLAVLPAAALRGQIADDSASPGVRYDRLAQQDVAEALKLTDEQRSGIREIIERRNAALRGASEAQQAEVSARFENQLVELLTDQQRTQFEALAGEKRLQFNFKFQKWADVLEWVAEEADLSLVMDAPPAGSFNYSDSKQYTPTQAIDVLNGWLLTKRYALIRRDRLLMCIDLTEGLPEGVVPRVALERLPTLGRFELASVLIPLEGRPAETVTAEIDPLLGTYGNLSPLPATKQVLVTDTAENLRAIQAVVRAIPVPAGPKPSTPPPKPVLTVYPIEHANPERAGEVLEKLLSGDVVVDAEAAQVSVNAIPDQQAKAKQVIEQLEANQGPDQQPRLQLYDVGDGDSSQLIGTLQLIAPSASFRVDPSANSLVVWASPKDHANVVGVLEKLGADQQTGGRRQLQVFPMTSVDPATAQSLLSQLLPQARLTVDAVSRTLIAFASQADLRAINTLLEQLQPDEPRPDTPQLKTYPAQQIDVASVTALLTALAPRAQVTEDPAKERLFVIASAADQSIVSNVLDQIGPDEADATASLKPYPVRPPVDLSTVSQWVSTLAPRAQVTIESANRRLLVMAVPKDHEVIAKIVQQIGEVSEAGLPELRFYPLDNARGDNAVAVLGAIAPDAQISYEAEPKRLSIVATLSSHEAIAATLEKLEAASSAVEQRTLEIYDVTASQRTRFQTMASELAAELPGMQLLTDAEPGELAVWAKPSQHAVIAEVLNRLRRDVPENQKPRLIAYPIKEVDATSVHEVLTNLFPDFKITVDAKTSRLLIWAKPADHTTVRAAIEQLDSRTAVETELKLMAYPVDGMDSAVALQVVQRELPDVAVIPDQTAGTLIVRARLREHERVASLLDALRSASDPGRRQSVVVYPPVLGDPARTTEFLGAAFPAARVIIDPSTRRTMVWASQRDHAEIKAALEKMTDVGGSEVAPALKTYSIGTASPSDLSQMLSKAVPLAQFVVNPAQRKLVVWAEPHDQGLIEEIVTGVVSGAGSSTGKTLEVFDVRRMGPSTARQALAPAVPDVEFFDTLDGRSIMAWVTAEQRRRVAEMLEGLKSRYANDPHRMLQIYRIENLGGDAARQIIAAAVPRVSFTSTDGNKTLVAWVDSLDDKKIQQTLDRLAKDRPFEDGRTLEVYRSRRSDPNLPSVVGTAVPGATVYAGPRPGQIIVVADKDQHATVGTVLQQLDGLETEQGDRKLTVYDVPRVEPEVVRQVLEPLVDDDVQLTLDPDGRRLFVRASEAKHEQIRDLVERMTTSLPNRGGAVTKAYRLNNRDADEAQEALSALFPQATLVTDSDQKVLVATALPDEHETIDNVVKQMTGEADAESAPQPRTYRLATADGSNLLEMLERLFDDTDVRLSLDAPNRTLVAVARPNQHQTIRDLIDQIESGDAPGERRSVKFYALADADGESLAEIMRSLLASVDSEASVVYDAGNRNLAVTTSPSGHERVAEAVGQLQVSDATDIEVFQLYQLDATSAQISIESVFSNDALEMRPIIQADDDTQQLIVKGSGHQIDQIRNLLIKMGETTLAQRTGTALRVIQVEGDVDAAVEQIERLWTRLRRNPIRILKRGGRSREIPRPKPDTDKTRPDGNQQRPTAPDEEDDDSPGAQFSVSSDEERATGEDADPPYDEEVPPEDTEPVFLVPGDGRIVVSSEDAEALDQLESIVRAVFSGRRTGRNKAFTVYQLQNAGASNVSDILQQLFNRRGPSAITSGDVVVVPDQRLNALIVFAGRSDRANIEPLVEILDSENIPDTLATLRPRVIPIRYADAAKVSNVLSGIYKAQMTAGGQRQSISIPEGVSSQVANVLRQINAASSAPLLSIEVDQATNSLVAIAPQDLMEEVAALASELDEAAQTRRAGEIRILPLQKTNTSRVMEVLDRLLD